MLFPLTLPAKPSFPIFPLPFPFPLLTSNPPIPLSKYHLPPLSWKHFRFVRLLRTAIGSNPNRPNRDYYFHSSRPHSAGECVRYRCGSIYPTSSLDSFVRRGACCRLRRRLCIGGCRSDKLARMHYDGRELPVQNNKGSKSNCRQLCPIVSTVFTLTGCTEMKTDLPPIGRRAVSSRSKLYLSAAACLFRCGFPLRCADPCDFCMVLLHIVQVHSADFEERRGGRTCATVAGEVRWDC